MAIGMNANFGNFNPAQYQREDNTLSSIGNRFANVAANIPGLVREGEKWQDERDARGRAQEARNSDENLKTHLYNGMQELNNELGGGAFQLRPPERGESIENYTAYTGNVLQSVLDNNPGAYDKVMQAATKVGAKLNSDDALEKYALGQQGAETQGQGVGGMLSPQPAQEQPPARVNRFEGLGGASNEGALAMIQAAGEQQGGFENDPNSSGMRNILLNSGDPELRTASSYIQSLPRDEYPQESISGQTQPDGIPTMIQPLPETGQATVTGGDSANRFANVTPERAATLRAAMADTKNRIDNLTARINNLYAERRMSPERIWKHEDRLDRLQEKYDKYDAELNGLPKTEKVDPNADLTRKKIEAEIDAIKARATKDRQPKTSGGDKEQKIDLNAKKMAAVNAASNAYAAKDYQNAQTAESDIARIDFALKLTGKGYSTQQAENASSDWGMTNYFTLRSDTSSPIWNGRLNFAHKNIADATVVAYESGMTSDETFKKIIWGTLSQLGLYTKGKGGVDKRAEFYDSLKLSRAEQADIPKDKISSDPHVAAKLLEAGIRKGAIRARSNGELVMAR